LILLFLNIIITIYINTQYNLSLKIHNQTQLKEDW